jgi:hypothetical protein
MVTLLIITLAIVSIIGTGLYFWLKTASEPPEHVLPPPPDLHGLFGGAPDREEQLKMAIEARELAQAALIARAKNGERSALEEASRAGNVDLYDRVLSELLHLADSDEKLLSLTSYVAKNEFRVNRELGLAAMASWQKSPDRSGTSKALHFAALSDDADVYRGAVEQALTFWRERKLSDVSATELRALFDGEFWILSSRTRSSGAGFILKRTLDSARRELEAAVSKVQA